MELKKSCVKLVLEKLVLVLLITTDFKVTRSAQHRCRVDLAHVPSLVAGLDALDVEVPLFPLRL